MLGESEQALGRYCTCFSPVPFMAQCSIPAYLLGDFLNKYFNIPAAHIKKNFAKEKKKEKIDTHTHIIDVIRLNLLFSNTSQLKKDSRAFL